MKIWFRCCKCGAAFEAEERVRTDICPHCMSFVDLARAEKLVGKPSESEKAAAPAFPSSEDGAQSPSAAPFSAAKAQETVQQRPHSPQESVSPPRNAPTAKSAEPSAFGAEDTYDSLYSEAENMMTFGAWGNAAALFRRCLEKRESWQARFGLVRAATRELTDLSNFADVQKDADAAFDAMTETERLSLGKRYVPKLEEKRLSLKNSLSLLERNDLHEFIVQEDKQSTLGNPNRKGVTAIIIGTTLLIIFLIIAAALFSALQEQPAIGAVVLCVGVAVGVLCIAFGARAYSREKRINAAKEAVRAVTEQMRDTERAKLKAQIDAVDYLCGYLKY